MSRTKIFISYSHKDERWRERVASQLAVLASEGLIDLWDDRKIGAGDDWLTQIERQMLNARIAVLLISAPFLTSEFIRKKEIPALFERHKKDGMTIYPLLIKPCLWQEVAWLAKMQIRPRGEKAVASYKTIRAEEILAGVAGEIASIARGQAQDIEQPGIKNRDKFSQSIKITIPPVEQTFSTAPTTLDALTNRRLLELGIEKDRRYYKIHLRNRNKSKTIRNIRADLVNVALLELNQDIPLHLQSKNLLVDLKSHFPLRLCFTENRKPPYKDHINLSPEGEASIDVIRWEYDGQHQPTFFLCHTKEGTSGEIPLGKYELRVKITADDVASQEKTFLIGKRGQEFILTTN